MTAGSVGVKLARDVEMNLYLGRSKLQIQSRKHIHIARYVQYDIKSTICLTQSWNSKST